MRVTGTVAVLLLGWALSGCSGGSAAPATPVAVAPTPTPPAASAPASPSPSPSRIGQATAAPRWLGTRVLPVGPDGFAAARKTPAELRDRSIITVDDLPPPTDGRFHSTIQRVPAGVLARSSWTQSCPVAAADLRYVTVTFRGFDGLAHTGELLVNARVATDLVTVFRRLYAAAYPIERMRISSAAELNAPPTGDDNTTESFACRPVRGQKSWSQHAYGLAVDVNPFQNPYHKGDVVLPELATAYLDRADVRPGMVQPRSTVVRAFEAVGWKWGGDYASLRDYMHFSATGG
ncbi:M15 family metallopeptidase [Hamadaea tsunoensis]|uniref:M15 family metallopeptidase n=1 Tax=Hamadaea tsunoensis TaxID=53368 RepID=UPI00041E43F3|nr:M15 family metallopeptidase [Hamadaea tsunoensis]